MKRVIRIAIVTFAILLMALLLLGWLLQPQRAGRYLLRTLGNTLGLEITATGIDYRLRGTPQLVLRDVEAMRTGDQPLLRARRVFVSLPWRTLRTRGDDLVVQRIELDAPTLDIPALQRWLATRPPGGETRLPTLTDGLRIVDGRIDNDDWNIDGLHIDVPTLHPAQALRARVRGRYFAAPLSIPADLAITLEHPDRLLAGRASGIASVGTLSFSQPGWQVPAQVFLAGPLRIGRDSALMKPAKVGIAAHYKSASSELPFRLGLHGPMSFNKATWRFVPVTVVLDGSGAIPDARARGSLSVGRVLRVKLDGSIKDWPDTWPALPAPLSRSSSAMPFALDYQGGIDFSDIASLQLQRDDARFDTRFRLPAVLTWLDAKAASPLPPLQGTLSVPRVEVSGATLEGVEIEIDDTP
ncbi:MAG: hypothetical protein QM612_05800 [Thermomonas sp.]|uniref:hypothetical protein n=1 Tax=Thermomonas sp. TaxID=1971895 RepID=UPI0039E2E650